MQSINAGLIKLNNPQCKTLVLGKIDPNKKGSVDHQNFQLYTVEIHKVFYLIDGEEY